LPEPVTRNGLSLASNDYPFPSCHWKVNIPGLFLRHPLNFALNPFGSSLVTLAWFAPGQGDFNATDPLSITLLSVFYGA